MSLVAIVLVVVTVTVVASLGGIAVGRRIGPRLSEPERSQLFALQASLLGLLALLLGFSFGLAESRYDLRKQTIVEEANAIGTSWLRTAAVPDDPGREIAGLLERYVAVRLAGYAARDDAGLRAALDESVRLQSAAWARASLLLRREPRSLPAALLVQSLNDVIDCNTKRVAAGQNHVPTAVLILLVGLATVTLGWVGAGVGLSSRRGVLPTLVLALLIAAVIVTIVDLDRPRGGIIRVSQATLVELQRSFR